MDSLFVIKKSKSDKDINLNTILSTIDPEHKSLDNLNLTKQSVVGYPEDGTQFDGKPLWDYLGKYINQGNKQIASLTAALISATPREALALETTLSTLNTALDTLTEFAQLAAKNDIVNNFSSNMVEMKNRKDLLTPISFEDVVANRSEMQANLVKELKDDSFIQLLASSGLIEIKC